MPRIDFPSPGILIPIEGLYTIGENQYERRLKVKNMKEDFEDKIVIVDLQMLFYQNNELVETSKLVKPINVSITATNEELCDAMTGQVLCFTKDEYIDGVLNPALLNEDGTEKNYSPQYDWFFNLGETTPIVVHDFIKSFALTAVAEGVFE